MYIRGMLWLNFNVSKTATTGKFTSKKRITAKAMVFSNRFIYFISFISYNLENFQDLLVNSINYLILFLIFKKKSTENTLILNAYNYVLLKEYPIILSVFYYNKPPLSL